MKPPVDRDGYAAGDIRPDGGYVAAAVRDSFLLTHLGTLVCPDEPRWPRITTTGSVKIAYQGARRTPEWSASAGSWQFYAEACGAPSPVIYDRDGRLRLSDCSGASEGYHSVAPDGRLVWGNEVTLRAGSELRESTDLGGGIYVGQGPEGGCWAQAPDGYREIGSGIAKCVRATRDGDDIGICWYEPDVPHVGSATARFRWMTVAELLALPAKPTTKPPVSYAPVVSIGRPLWFGFFTGWAAPDRFDSTLPGNCYLHVPAGDHHPWLEVKTPDGRVAFRYTSGTPDGDRSSLEARCRAAAGPVPVIGYATMGMLASGTPNVDIVGYECYRLVSESDAQYRARVRGYAAQGRRCVLIAQAYSSNGAFTTDLRQPIGIISETARDYPNVIGVLAFSGPSRGTNITEHPAALIDWHLFGDGIPGAPAIEVRQPPKPAEPVKPIEPAPVPAPPNDPEIPETSPEPEPIPDPPMITRPPTRTGGNAIADFFRALTRINFRKLFKGWLR